MKSLITWSASSMTRYRVTVIGSHQNAIEVIRKKSRCANCVLSVRRNRQNDIAQQAAQEVRGRRTTECVWRGRT
jgi:hypothetical protein